MCSARSALMIKVHPWHRWDLLIFEAACFLDIRGGAVWCGRCLFKERWNENYKEKEKVGSLQVCFGPPSLSGAKNTPAFVLRPRKPVKQWNPVVQTAASDWCGVSLKCWFWLMYTTPPSCINENTKNHCFDFRLGLANHVLSKTC